MLPAQPGTLPVGERPRRRLADADAAVVVKLGRSYHNVREALASVTRRTFYVERASTAANGIAAADVDETSVPYFAGPCCRAGYVVRCPVAGWA